jgi:hypothetical protein
MSSSDDSVNDVLSIYNTGANSSSSSSNNDTSSVSTSSCSSCTSSTTSGGLLWSDDAPSGLDPDDGHSEVEVDVEIERAPNPYHFWKRKIVKKAARMNDRQFHRNFRMSKETFEKLLNEIADKLPIGRSTNGKNLSPRERLLTFLWFCGGNSSLGQGEYAHSMGFGSVHNRQATFQ